MQSFYETQQTLRDIRVNEMSSQIEQKLKSFMYDRIIIFSFSIFISLKILF